MLSKNAYKAIPSKAAIIGGIGAAIGLLLTGLIGHSLHGEAMIWLIAPLGASAVLLFAVPASPLAQPWPVLAGNTLSAVIGVLCAKLGISPLSAALAGGLSIVVMHLFRCLHPPGGAVALTAVLASSGPLGQLGLSFVWFPVALNTVVLLVAAWLFHRLSGHSYPHKPIVTPRINANLRLEDLTWAMQHYQDQLDISVEDLHAVVQLAQQRNVHLTDKSP